MTRELKARKSVHSLEEDSVRTPSSLQTESDRARKLTG